MYNNKSSVPFKWKKVTNAKISTETFNFTLLLIIFININQITGTKFIPVDHNSQSTHSAILSDGPAIGAPDQPVDPLLTRTYVRGYKQQNPNVISIGAVLESQEAIAQFLQVIYHQLYT